MNRQNISGRTAPSWLERAVLWLNGPILCAVCGSLTRFRVTDTSLLRENCPCQVCGANNRQRHVALQAARAFGCPSLRSLARRHDLVVYNTEARGPLHEQLVVMPNYVCSEYFGPMHVSGDTVNGIMHQDLMALSLQDESVDLIISSEVFEHIPNPYDAHKEVHRILKNGGRRVFSVPVDLSIHNDSIRASLQPDESILFHQPP